MPLLRPRNRVVYFRLSEEEYKRCLRLCETGEARSISDLARTAMAHWLAGGHDSHGEAWREPLDHIAEKLDRILEAVNRPNAETRTKAGAMLRAKA